MNSASKKINIKLLDKIISKKKINTVTKFSNITITQEMLDEYLKGLIADSLSDNSTRNELLESSKLECTGEATTDKGNIEYKLPINTQNIDNMCEQNNIVPQEIIDAIENNVIMSAYGQLYEIDAEEKIDTLQLMINGVMMKQEVLQKYITQSISQDDINDLKSKTSELATLNIDKMPFSKVIKAKDLYIKLLFQNSIFDKQLFDIICEYVKINEKNITYEQFIELCDSNIIMAYDLLNIIISNSYNIKKKFNPRRN